MILLALTLLLVPLISAEDIQSHPGNCSEAYFYCHKLANCEEIPNTETFRCICQNGTFGDGYKAENSTGCQETVYACTLDSNCHPSGHCNKTDPAKPICNCNDGFQGDGKHQCDDINECDNDPCDKNAICQNNQPGFKCACGPLYTGDGFTCSRFCSVKHDCFQPTGDCVDSKCVCKAGYEGDAVTNCTDVNECDTGAFTCMEPSECKNNDGGYDCECPNGYLKEQDNSCRKLYINCDDIYQNMPSAVSGRTYDIDPDSTGPLGAIRAKCEFRNGMGITIVSPTDTEPTLVSDTTRVIDYVDANPDSIKGLVDNSQFCYQSQWIECRGGYNLHESDLFQWTDAQDVIHKSWGGSTPEGKCACGILGFCTEGSACNCDGSTTKTVIDFGKNFDSNQLPAKSITFKSQSGSKTAKYVISEIKCAPKPFDLEKDCEAVKKSGVEEDGPQVIDFDGPDGPLEPTLVHCDINTYSHAAVTVLPNDRKDNFSPTSSGSNPLTYVTPDDTIRGIIEGSAFCSQEIKYTCRNSPINLNGQPVVFVSVGSDSRQLHYFPGGQGEVNSCGCGIVGACAQADVKCNCDINDNTTRYDIGVETNKTNLPIVSISVGNEGDDVYTEIEIGPLKCAHQQFGIEPNCEKYRAVGRVDAYAYLIDPDGPIDPKKPSDPNVDPFTAECVFTEYPPQGVTIIHHDSEATFTVTDINFIFEIAYRRVLVDEQLVTLRNRASYCVQALTFDCEDYHLHLSGDNAGGVVWKDLDGNSYDYLAGGGADDKGCQCNLEGSCLENKLCNCDAAAGQVLQDSGMLSNVTHLPVSALDFAAVNSQSSGNSSLKVTLGPLKCYETFQSCYDLWAFMRTRSLVGELKVESGKFTIDPDEDGGVEAFTVTCNFPFTVVPVSPGLQYGPTPGASQCYDVTYRDTDGNPISNQQITALVKHSKACQQHLSYQCTNAPKTGHVNYTSCDGTAQPGWAVSGGFDTCSCGLLGTCAGGADTDCNCDKVDGVARRDEGYIYNTTRLPVCQVCLSLDGIDPENPPPGNVRKAKFSVGYLNCLGYEFGGRESCEDRRLHRKESDAYYTDPDSKYSGTKAFPVYCNMIPYPAMGIMEIRPRQSDIVIPANQVLDITLTYYVYKKEDVDKLIDNSYYCTQEIWITCNSGSLDLSGTNGWYSRDGTPQNSWGGNIGAAVKCEGDGSNCNCNSPGSQIDGGILGEKSLLPISRVKLGASPTERILNVGAVLCYEIRKNCTDIMRSGNTKTPYKNDTYVIDPDGPDGVKPFIVKCHFDSKNDNAITEVIPVDSEPETDVTGKTDPDSYSIPFEYKGATPEQINALTRQAPFCYQGILYECSESPITDAVEVSLNGQASNNFGTAFNTSIDGCPCDTLGSCGTESACRCDAKGSMVANDNGTIANRDVLPVTEVKIGGQTANGVATVSVTSVKCSERPDKFPRDCEDAYKRGYKTGEVLINPTGQEVFYVFCDMEINPGHGVAIINTNFQPETTVPYDGTPLIVTYKGPTDEQIRALVDISSNCYQPVKYNCLNTQFSDKFSWNEGLKYFGAGSAAKQDCTCGASNLCGGDGGKTVMQQRDCNCDVSDGRARSDSGVFDSTNDLPVKALTFQATGEDGSQGNITIGQLFCGQSPIHLDECKLGFEDCHHLARCINTASGFECVCQAKWQGRGRSDVWANGRECYDDNECAFLPCESNAICNNLPGDYNCTCRPGYRQINSKLCEDINECTEDTHNCDANAKCFNTIGSFYCRCKRGFRGAGIEGTCTAIGICACFGDPHCISFDDKWLHYMGDCQYVMAQDGCDGSPQTFRVLTRNWDMNKRDISHLTWVKEVTVEINGTEIFLGQHREIRINKRTSLAYTKDDIIVDDNGREVSIITTWGLEIYWDGSDEVEVILPKQYVGKTCGLCGNFNGDIDDDWIVGNHCDETGSVITENENLFGNSWVSPEYLSVDPTCQSPCDPPPTNNTVCDEVLINFYCNRVFDPEISPFRDCLLAMDERVLIQLMFSCVFDLCNVHDDFQLGMCSSAERVVNECQRNMDIDIGVWRRPDFCPLTCGENMEYRVCGPAGEPDQTRQKTCSNDRLGTQPDNPGFCSEGCYCKQGYILESDRCLKEPECGCILDGVYMSIGQTYVDPGCKTEQVCGNNGTITQSPVNCGANSECVLNEESGIFGCHCAKGFRGDGFTCSDDPCFNLTCPGENTECVNGKCQCEMGFQGDCNSCEDIDECATNTHKCLYLGQKCKNYPGGYSCSCLSGYVKFGNFCQDINECEAGLDSCGDHSECVNKHGGYVCSCCDGYVKNGLGQCAPDVNNPPSASSAKCCSCTGDICGTDGQVCGNDGVTYNNEKALRIASCKDSNKQGLDVSYRGACKGTCSGVQCERPFETCKVDPLSRVALCECPKCGDGLPPRPEDQVCSSRLIFFPNQCHFEQIMCEINDPKTVILADATNCVPGPGGNPVGPWTEWSTCDVDCGPGKMTRTRLEERPRTTYEKIIFALEEAAVCYGNCSNPPCGGYKCSGNGEVCIPGENSTEPMCICPNCDHREDEPICGLIGSRQMSFKNKCELQRKACIVNKVPHLLSESACGAKPLNCSLYTDYSDMSEGGCESSPVPVGKCEGGCGSSPDKCCEIIEEEDVSYQLTCAGNGTTFDKTVKSALKCKCNDLQV